MALSRLYCSFSTIQTVAKWAAVIGMIQSVVWIILSIIAILLYTGTIDMNGQTHNYGSITLLVLYQMYFNGSDGLKMPPIFDPIKSVGTVFEPWQILIWVCIYLGVSLMWLISCILIFTHVKKTNINASIAVLYTWASLTFITCCMDFCLGILFGIDFHQYQSKAYNTDITSNEEWNAELISAQFAAISMMLIALKGFVLWLINLGLIICLIIGANVARDTLNDHINHAFTFNSTHVSPIHAFEPKDETGFDNEAFVVEQRQQKSPLELNEESIKRAVRMSMDTLQERRFRNIESFEQYPPAKLPQIPLNQPQQSQQMVNFEPVVPAPDYTPPMPRANQNGNIRNSRY